VKKFKIRASASGKIMGGTVGLTDAQQKELDILNDRKSQAVAGVEKVKPLTPAMEKKLVELFDKRNNPQLPQGARTYCDDWIKEQIYSRRKEFTSKYTDKGIIVEDNSLDFIAERLGLGMLFKNEEQFENEFMIGEPDTIIEDRLIDAKNSWDCHTFPLLNDNIDMDYFHQGQVYMALTGLKHYSLVYVLSDTPMHLIMREASFYANNNGMEVDDVMEEFIAKMTYPDIPDKYKLKKYDFEYSQEVVDNIEKRVKLCRDYIETRIIGL
jgi:hypothetical protein